MNRNSVISSSGTPGRPCAQDSAMLASSTPPTPSVVALVGACRRMKKSGKRSMPIAPTSVNTPPTTSSAATPISIHHGRVFIVGLLSFDHVAAAEVARQRHRRGEAEHRDDQRRLEQQRAAP